MDFGQELGKVWIAVRRFDIDHRVEARIGKRQVLGVSLDELQAVNLVPLVAKLHAGGIEVESGQFPRLEISHHVAGSASMAATDLQNLLLTQIGLRNDVVIQP